ncbi:TetR/AcrR family transcriptional regulator [Streptomyces sp. GMY01]|uniref:TetR/AcrR family transcriptional regulator n=1 Tax=Streptomyces sp. GMY02 TaxID=1333528 RepID=UPI00146BB6A6|nr:TetR/AcrR family transcriptional regulator [Streptomyces sp. GMY02]NMO34940.1 TetR/AcrR family transcriptional regulator [Streptomyces sp. GMY02]
MPKSPTKRRPITRAALTDSALALFTEKGFHATSISDIVERAGLTRGAFYSNYRDKEELFLALYDAHTERLLSELREAATAPQPEPGSRTDSASGTGTDSASASGSGSGSGVHPVMQLHERVTGRTPQERQWFIVSMEFTLHAARHPEVARALAVHENRLTEGLAEVVTTALAGAGRRPDLAPEDLARLLVAAFEGLTARQLVHGTGEPTERLLTHLMNALSAPLGPSDEGQ